MSTRGLGVRQVAERFQGLGARVTMRQVERTPQRLERERARLARCVGGSTGGPFPGHPSRQPGERLVTHGVQTLFHRGHG
jgi:hypothetical protein